MSLSVCLSNSAIVSKWFKLGLRNLHCRLSTASKTLSLRICKVFASKIRKESPRLKAINQRGYEKIGDSEPISRRISKTVRNRVSVIINY